MGEKTAVVVVSSQVPQDSELPVEARASKHREARISSKCVRLPASKARLNLSMHMFHEAGLMSSFGNQYATALPPVGCI